MTGTHDVLAEELAGWPVGSAEAAVVDASGEVAIHGAGGIYRWASVTKLVTALVVLDAAWEGDLDLDQPAGPPGATVRHLLAHTSGLSVDSERTLAPPGRRRIYSNRGFEVLGELIERRTGRPFAERARAKVLDPLHMTSTTITGSAAHGAEGAVQDLASLARELLSPDHFPVEGVKAATTTAFPDLAGVLPGFGRQDPNDWGLGFEIHSRKNPHWMAPENSATAFGHFGQSGSFLWVDPVAGLACAAVCDTPFGSWAASSWPRLSERVLRSRGRTSRPTSNGTRTKETAP
jgi:CubicO group peptidase (beta-lactamase class C family)